MTISLISTQVALIVGYVLAVLGIAHMLRHRRSPSATIAWLMAFVLLPYLGVILYLVFGRRKVIQISGSPALSRGLDNVAREDEICAMLQKYQIAAPTNGNRVTLCPTGVEGYKCLQDLIENAKSTIYIQTFIFSHDEIGQEILWRLTAKAKSGVKVCLLVDGLGSIKTRRTFFRTLVDAGGQFAVFEPVIHVPFRSLTNLRMHRKIAVADGCRALAGGMNITQEDMYAQAGTGCWQDLSFVVEGPAAQDLENIFRSDWHSVTGRLVDPGIPDIPPPQGDAMVQIVPSGPNIQHDPLYAAVLSAIFRATRRVWIATPYFVPTDSLALALEIACHRGVDVRVLVPQKSNHQLSDLAGAGFLRDIEDAGGTPLLYTGGMMHAKVMIVDDSLSMVGSANMDMRSLFLDYEVMQLSFSAAEISAVEAWYANLAKGCRTGVPEPGLRRQLAEGLVRTIAPLF